MKTTNKVNLSFGLFVLFAVQILFSCEDHTLSPENPADYFPLSDNTVLNYLKKNISTEDNATVWSTDTVTFTVLGDSLIEGITYKKILNKYGFLEKVIRKEGSKYFGRHHELYGNFTQEYMFLDTDVPVDGSWEHIKNEGMTKTEYVVKAVDARHSINDVEYTNVIKIEVNYYDKYTDGVNFELRFSTAHYYADGVGEIYTYYPSAAGHFSNEDISLLPILNE